MRRDALTELSEAVCLVKQRSSEVHQRLTMARALSGMSQLLLGAYKAALAGGTEAEEPLKQAYRESRQRLLEELYEDAATEVQQLRAEHQARTGQAGLCISHVVSTGALLWGSDGCCAQLLFNLVSSALTIGTSGCKHHFLRSRWCACDAFGV